MCNRTDWVDYAKAIGIILVVYGHVARGLYNAGIYFPENIYKLADSVVYSFHMPLFFFLSGLFFQQTFIKKGGIGLGLIKIDTIVYPYLLWSILQGAIEIIMSNYTNGNVTLADVLSLWEPRAQFWFLYALFSIFVICSAFYSLFSEISTRFFLISACVLYVCGPVLQDFIKISFIVNNLVYFVLGILFAKNGIEKILSSGSALLAMSIIFVLFQYLFHGYFEKLYTDQGFETLLLACVSIFFIVALSIAISKKPIRFLAHIGASSMAIYLMHILAGSGTRVILDKILAIDSFGVHLFFGCIGGILMPLFVLKYINTLRISYVFSAPISKRLEMSYNWLIMRIRR